MTKDKLLRLSQRIVFTCYPTYVLGLLIANVVVFLWVFVNSLIHLVKELWSETSKTLSLFNMFSYANYKKNKQHLFKQGFL